MVIVETTLARDRLKEKLPALLTESGTSCVRYGQMPGMLWLPEGMEEWFAGAQGYLALTLG